MSKKAGGKGGIVGRVIRNLLVLGLVFGVLAPVALTLVYRFVPPPITYLMVQRLFEGQGLDHRWRSLNSMSPNMVRAVIASEDQNFCSHRGFDFEAIQKAMAFNEDSDRTRGGSTISQQAAKNVFLWPQRSWLRKGAEAYFTVLIETLWGKKRIMEVYLNSIEMGPGVYGAESASQRYFDKGADRLTATQAARLAAVLPSPLRYKVVSPGPYVARRTSAISRAAGAVRRDGLAACVLG